MVDTIPHSHTAAVRLDRTVTQTAITLELQRKLNLDRRLNGDANRRVKVNVYATGLQRDDKRVTGHPVDDLWSGAITPPTTDRLDAQPISPQQVDRRSTPGIAVQRSG